MKWIVVLLPAFMFVSNTAKSSQSVSFENIIEVVEGFGASELKLTPVIVENKIYFIPELLFEKSAASIVGTTIVIWEDKNNRSNPFMIIKNKECQNPCPVEQKSVDRLLEVLGWRFESEMIKLQDKENGVDTISFQQKSIV